MAEDEFNITLICSHGKEDPLSNHKRLETFKLDQKVTVMIRRTPTTKGAKTTLTEIVKLENDDKLDKFKGFEFETSDFKKISFEK